MANIESHPSGSFCWVELATTDQIAAKKFYGSLFGWSVADMPMGPGDFYSIFKLEGRDTGAAYTLRKDQRERDVPPHWMVYVAVESADKAAAKAAELGGKILAPAFDVFDAGRMAVSQDPTGATFCVWQAKKNKGIGIGGVEGTFCWADLSTPDPEKAKRFYSGLFGWRIAAGEHDSSGYLHIKNGEHFIGGVPPAKYYNPQVPPHWLSYFHVSDVDATAAKAGKAGAKLHLPPMTIENVGRMAVIADPHGAAFAVFKSARK